MSLAVGVIYLISTSATSVIEVRSAPSRNLGIPGQGVFLGTGLAHVAVPALPWGLDFLFFLLVYRLAPN